MEEEREDAHGAESQRRHESTKMSGEERTEESGVVRGEAST